LGGKAGQGKRDKGKRDRARESGTESAGINRHIVGDARALQKRRSDSILASSLALQSARAVAKRRQRYWRAGH
jgi:hypothetical protein